MSDLRAVVLFAYDRTFEQLLLERCCSLLTRLLELEQRLYETQQERDDWRAIAARRRRPELAQAADGPR